MALDISTKLTQQQLQEILLNIYYKGQQESENLKAMDLIEDIKQQVISALIIGK